MFCSKCGKEMPDTENFCSSCGKKTGETTENVSVRVTSEQVEINKVKNKLTWEMIAGASAILTIILLFQKIIEIPIISAIQSIMGLFSSSYSNVIRIPRAFSVFDAVVFSWNIGTSGIEEYIGISGIEEYTTNAFGILIAVSGMFAIFNILCILNLGSYVYSLWKHPYDIEANNDAGSISFTFVIIFSAILFIVVMIINFLLNRSEMIGEIYQLIGSITGSLLKFNSTFYTTVAIALVTRIFILSRSGTIFKSDIDKL